MTVIPRLFHCAIALAIAAFAVTIVLPASAQAAIKAEVSISSGSQVVAKLSSSKKLKKNKRPTAVSVKGGGKSYKLSRKKKGLGAWKSRKYSGADAKAVAALAGQPVTVVIKSKSGRSSIASTVAGGPPPPGPATSGKLFDLPAQELIGNDALNAFSKYFLNSRFTDCPAGWPNCAVEQRYVQCPNGSWEYHRYTNSSGSDINSYGSFQVTGAASHPDGSWGVEYNVTAYGSQSFYSWNVSAAGVVTGTYSFNGSQEPLGPLQWLAGGC
jgi:hypothetical protein